LCAMSGEEEKRETSYRIGIANFERRKYPRFNIDLPVEYCRTNAASFQVGRAMNASEGGLLVYFPERMEVGQHLKLRLFFAHGTELNRIEALVEVAWTDIHLGEGWGDYRAGVIFLQISAEDVDRLKRFLESLAGR
jgi:c-di-GMP-binding flagellar brake protein YcgR